MRLPVAWRASGLEAKAACWLWSMEAVYPLLTGDTPVAPERLLCIDEIPPSRPVFGRFSAVNRLLAWLAAGL